ncbi:Uncharacterised protein [uncultured Clostridium sp.]|nr:Uncharacterised protein [uncultured Clostridium sp.]
MSLCSIYNKRSNREKIKRNFSDGTRYRTTDLRSAVKVTADASAAGAAGNLLRRRKRKDDSGAGACTTGGRLRSTRAYCAVFKGNRDRGACVSCANSADQPGALRQKLGIYLFHDGAGQKGDHRVSQPDAAGGDFHGKKRRNRRADFR